MKLFKDKQNICKARSVLADKMEKAGYEVTDAMDIAALIEMV